MWGKLRSSQFHEYNRIMLCVLLPPAAACCRKSTVYKRRVRGVVSTNGRRFNCCQLLLNFVVILGGRSKATHSDKQHRRACTVSIEVCLQGTHRSCLQKNRRKTEIPRYRTVRSAPGMRSRAGMQRRQRVVDGVDSLWGQENLFQYSY